METESKKTAFEKMLDENQAGVYDLAPGLSSEQMTAIFFNEDALIAQPQPIYRLNGTSKRYYYTFDEKILPIFYTSVTTMIKQTMPTSPHLIKWIADLGYEESRNYAQERADYGTFMHIEIAELLISRRYDTDKLKKKLKAYIEEHKLPVDFINHADELKKDMLAFAQFMVDCKVKPLAIEIVLAHPTDGYAGAIDLVCEMEMYISEHRGEIYKTGVNKGKPRKTKELEKFRAIIDFKSGRKGFYEEHEVQLQSYAEMWQIHFPNKKVDRVFNWSPKEWRNAPTYNLKDQTQARSRAKLQYLVELNRIEMSKRSNAVTIIEGVLDIDKGIDNNYTEISLHELVIKNKDEKDKPKK